MLTCRSSDPYSKLKYLHLWSVRGHARAPTCHSCKDSHANIEWQAICLLRWEHDTASAFASHCVCIPTEGVGVTHHGHTHEVAATTTMMKAGAPNGWPFGASSLLCRLLRAPRPAAVHFPNLSLRHPFHIPQSLGPLVVPLKALQMTSRPSGACSVTRLSNKCTWSTAFMP
jgi:hypothetical protein